MGRWSLFWGGDQNWFFPNTDENWVQSDIHPQLNRNQDQATTKPGKAFEQQNRSPKGPGPRVLANDPSSLLKPAMFGLPHRRYSSYTFTKVLTKVEEEERRSQRELRFPPHACRKVSNQMNRSFHSWIVCGLHVQTRATGWTL